MVRSRLECAFSCLLALLAVTLCARADDTAKKDETPAEKIRKTLDRSIALNFAGKDAKEVADHLKAKTGIDFSAAPETLLDEALGIPAQPTKFELKAEPSMKLGRALQRCLSRHGLTYVILEDSVLITTDDDAVAQQFGQLVSIHTDKVPLTKVLKDLQRTTPFNLIIDPRVSTEAKAPITMDIDNTMLESAVRLSAELAGLRVIRVDNVLLVCDEARFEKVWRAEKAAELLPNANRRNNNIKGSAAAALFGPGGFGMPVPPPVAAPPVVIPALPAIGPADQKEKK